MISFIESKRRAADYGAVRAAVNAWYAEASRAQWNNMADIKMAYASASVVTSDRVVFNIKGNDYRLVVAIDFEKSIVWIKWIGTHKEYDKIDVKEVKYNG